MTEAPYKPPPQSLTELRALVGEIKTGQAPTRLGARAFQTLTGMVDAPRQAAVYSISELAAALQVNASTLSRLAKRLGYTGFSDFQRVFRRQFASQREFYSQRMGRLLGEAEAIGEKESLVLQVADDERRNITEMLDRLDPVMVDTVAGALAGARRVRVHGLRQFFSLACFIGYGLGLIRGDVAVLGDTGHGVTHALAQLEANDALIVLGCAPYTRLNVDTCRVAARHGLKVIAITDSHGSPLAAGAWQAFIVPTRGRYYVNSIAAWTVLAEGLLALVAQRLGPSAVRALRKRESMFDELGETLPATPVLGIATA